MHARAYVHASLWSVVRSKVNSVDRICLFVCLFVPGEHVPRAFSVRFDLTVFFTTTRVDRACVCVCVCAYTCVRVCVHVCACGAKFVIS